MRFRRLWPEKRTRKVAKSAPQRHSGPNGGYCERDAQGKGCNRRRACVRAEFCLGDNEADTKPSWL